MITQNSSSSTVACLRREDITVTLRPRQEKVCVDEISRLSDGKTSDGLKIWGLLSVSQGAADKGGESMNAGKSKDERGFKDVQLCWSEMKKSENVKTCPSVWAVIYSLPTFFSFFFSFTNSDLVFL